MNTAPQRPVGRGIYLLPTLFTLTALFAGFFAIVTAMKGHYENAAIAIFVAMIMDTLDGRVARLTNTQTLFGAELDSLSDMVSFGLAPALVSYTWALDHLGKFGWLASFIFAVAVALRLARFNVPGGNVDKRYFRGLPSPAGAGVIAGIVWLGQQYSLNGHKISVLMAIINIIVGLLMVSKLLYRSFKDLDLKGKVPFIAILIVVVILVMIAISPPHVLLIAFALYALSGPVQWLWLRYRHSRRAMRINKIRKQNRDNHSDNNH